MDLQFHGANCISLTTKKAKVVIDDDLDKHGLKNVSGATISLFSSEALKPKSAIKDSFMIDGPGEYEVSGVSVIGIPAQGHMDEAGSKQATIYKIISSSVSLVSLGHIYPELSDDQLEAIGLVDVLITPVGGNGYTLDAVGATKTIKKISPKVVIPVHYKDSGVKYEVEQAELEEFLKELGGDPVAEEKLKLKSGTFSENLTIYKLSRV